MAYYRHEDLDAPTGRLSADVIDLRRSVFLYRDAKSDEDRMKQAEEAYRLAQEIKDGADLLLSAMRGTIE